MRSAPWPGWRGSRCSSWRFSSSACSRSASRSRSASWSCWARRSSAWAFWRPSSCRFCPCWKGSAGASDLLLLRLLDELRQLLERVDRRELVVVDRRELVADRVALDLRSGRKERELLELARSEE